MANGSRFYSSRECDGLRVCYGWQGSMVLLLIDSYMGGSSMLETYLLRFDRSMQYWCHMPYVRWWSLRECCGCF